MVFFFSQKILFNEFVYNLLLLFIFCRENCNQLITGGEEKQKNNKVRRRTTQAQELLYGMNASTDSQKSDDQNQNHNHPLTRVPSAPGSLK